MSPAHDQWPINQHRRGTAMDGEPNDLERHVDFIPGGDHHCLSSWAASHQNAGAEGTHDPITCYALTSIASLPENGLTQYCHTKRRRRQRRGASRSSRLPTSSSRTTPRGRGIVTELAAVRLDAGQGVAGLSQRPKCLVVDRGGCEGKANTKTPLPPWKWQLKKGPPWPREKAPPNSPQHITFLALLAERSVGLSGRPAQDRARSRRQGRQPREAGAERSDAP